MTAIEELAEIRTEVELELARAQLKQLRNDQQLRESGEVIGDRLGFLDDDARFEYRSRIFTGHESRLSDREDGKNEPIYENEIDLAEIRGDGRLLGQENPAGIGAQVALRNYTFGTGFEYDFSPKDKKDSALAEEVQTWNDEFDERLKWRFYEKEFHERSIQDGEPFLELEPIGGGRVDCLFREPDAITEPNDWRGMDDFTGQISTNWRFGIQTSLGRPHRPLSYFVDLTGDQTDWHWVPAARMVHGKRNVPANCKRGVSDFHPVSSELRRADKVLRNVGEGATVQSAIAFIREHAPGTTGSQVLSLGSGKTEFELNRTTPGGTSRTHRYQRYLPGTILDVRAGQVYKPGPMGTGAVFIDVGQAILRYVAVRWNMPEFIISSNAGNTNFASILVAETPFVKAIEAEQVWFIEFMAEAKWKMLAVAVMAGRFAQWGIQTLADLKTRIELEIKAPRVNIRNRLEETKIRDVLFQRGLVSKQTWSAKEELNYEHEQAMLKEDPPLPEQLNPSVLGKAGLAVGGGDKEFQPQGDEPGQNGRMPELGK